MTPDRPTLGIVTLSCNQARFLPDAMASVTVSRPGRLEYVVVDPGSEDGSRDLVLAQGDRVSARVFEPDSGPAEGLNKGVARLDTDVIGFLNADDFYLPGALDHVLSVFGREPGIDVLTGSLLVVDEDGRPKRGLVPSTFSARAYVEGWARVLQPSTFFSRRLWDAGARFDPENRTCWDAGFLVDAALRGARFERTRPPLASFRLHGGSFTARLHRELATGARLLAERYRADEAGIAGRVLAAGIRPRPWAPLARVGIRLDPVRRLRELRILAKALRAWRAGNPATRASARRPA
jgi:glycosyltransferase involved in cell wall biosynthesis